MQEALLGEKKELTPLRPEKQIHHYTEFDFSGAKAVYGTANLIPTVSAVPSAACQSVQ